MLNDSGLGPAVSRAGLAGWLFLAILEILFLGGMLIMIKVYAVSN